MLDRILKTGTQPLLKQLALFAERRQGVLAGNIANIDTPGYQMRDLPVAEFQSAMQDAVRRLNRPAQSPGEMSLQWAEPAPEILEDPAAVFTPDLFRAREPGSQPGITFQDANNRSIENQTLQMTRNSLLQTLALQLMSAQYAQLEAAITERA
jgi:flagellar basal-body rod protein FlgB